MAHHRLGAKKRIDLYQSVFRPPPKNSLPQMEAVMSKHTSIHVFLNWTKERVDEMDATLASIESKTSQMKADAKAKADQFVADLKKRRDEFDAKVKEQIQAGEAALEAKQAQLDSKWREFETQVKSYFETVGKQIEQQQATFQEVATAQINAWREAADKIHQEAAKLAAERRAEVDAAVKRMKADAADAETRLQKLKGAGSESWTALSAALAESRKAFDQANQQASDAFKRAAA
jgi:hypothetical protein